MSARSTLRNLRALPHLLEGRITGRSVMHAAHLLGSETLVGAASAAIIPAMIMQQITQMVKEGYERMKADNMAQLQVLTTTYKLQRAYDIQTGGLGTFDFGRARIGLQRSAERSALDAQGTVEYAKNFWMDTIFGITNPAGGEGTKQVHRQLTQLEKAKKLFGGLSEDQLLQKYDVERLKNDGQVRAAVSRSHNYNWWEKLPGNAVSPGQLEAEARKEAVNRVDQLLNREEADRENYEKFLDDNDPGWRAIDKQRENNMKAVEKDQWTKYNQWNEQ